MGHGSSQILPGSEGGRTDGSVLNVDHPLRFNTVHGDNILLAQSGAVARRAHSFCKAIAFSNRPIKVNERVCVKFVEVSSSWSGVLRFGFSSHDPSSIRPSLPKYACPDLTSRPGFWAKAFHDHLVKKDAILFYYVNHAGDVHFGINGEEYGVFFKDVDTRGPLWALFDIYGNTTAVELVDPKAHLNNIKRSLSNSDDISSLSTTFQSMNMSSSDVEINPIKHYPETVFYNLQFHETHGRHVELGRYRYIARKFPNEYSKGYVFTSRPVQVGETIVLQVQEVEPLYAGSMAFGLTSCNPESIHPNSLPDDSYLLQDRPEYWVVKKEAANNPQPGDELAFTVAATGAVLVSKNGGPHTVLMYVDTTVALYAFFDLYGTTQKLALVGSILPNPRRTNTTADCCNELQMSSQNISSRQIQELNFGTSPAIQSSSSVTAIPSTSRGQFKASAPLSKVVQPETFQFHRPSQDQKSFGESSQNAQTATLSLKTKNLQHTTTDNTKGTLSKYPMLGENTNWTVECVACCEKPVDSVFYQCGHLSMCYECAYEYWKTRQKKYCPICRAVITDVIKIYKS